MGSTEILLFSPTEYKPDHLSMAHSSNNNAPLLWIIGPTAICLTLLFISVNHHTVAMQERLSGERPVVEHKMEAPAHHMEAAPADSLHHEAAAADSLHHEAAPAAEGAHMEEHH